MDAFPDPQPTQDQLESLHSRALREFPELKAAQMVGSPMSCGSVEGSVAVEFKFKFQDGKQVRVWVGQTGKPTMEPINSSSEKNS